MRQLHRIEILEDGAAWEWSLTMYHPPTFRKPKEGRVIAVVGDVYHFQATGEETDGKYVMWEALVSPTTKARA